MVTNNTLKVRVNELSLLRGIYDEKIKNSITSIIKLANISNDFILEEETFDYILDTLFDQSKDVTGILKKLKLKIKICN